MLKVKDNEKQIKKINLGLYFNTGTDEDVLYQILVYVWSVRCRLIHISGQKVLTSFCTQGNMYCLCSK